MGLDGAKALIAVIVLYALIRFQQTAHADIRVGNAINVFNRYGYFSISMRVVPRNDTDHSWIFREPTVDVFTNVAEKQKYINIIYTFIPDYTRHVSKARKMMNRILILLEKIILIM